MAKPREKKSNMGFSISNKEPPSKGFSFFPHSIYSNLSDKDITVLSGLEELKGSAPTQLALSRKMTIMDIVDSIGKLENAGLVEKDEKEAAELGEKWAFHSLTSEGLRLAHGLKHCK